jgi:Na+/H+ antiporter NhaD/arsenite permease-like protein
MPDSPGLIWATPFVAILLSIAVFPLVPQASHWWDKNRNKLTVSLLLAAAVTAYYALRGHGFAEESAGVHSAFGMLHHAIIGDYIPFIILLFSLYCISGGIRFSGDVPAHPFTNTLILATGSVCASFVGTTGASMLLIRPLLQINAERKYVSHTVIFFIFLVSNIGGVLLPVGDPPLFLGYLRGVPFLWTLHLFPMWVFASVILLVVYYLIDVIAYRREPPRAVQMDETVRVPLRLEGKRNFVLLAGIVAAVALLVPGQPFAGTQWIVPDIYLREGVQLLLVAVSFWVTPSSVRKANGFDFGPINEVACLFIGIFITMQVPVEILRIRGATLGVTTPLQFFWASGSLSSFLDNAPTYTVFFELAGTLHIEGLKTLQHLATATGEIHVPNLLAISAGAVFMGANTYIGNGPNFLVRGIAERSGVKLPSFFGYMLWSGLILIPLFVLVSFVFFV